MDYLGLTALTDRWMLTQAPDSCQLGFTSSNSSLGLSAVFVVLVRFGACLLHSSDIHTLPVCGWKALTKFAENFTCTRSAKRGDF